MVGEGFALISRRSVSVSDVARSAARPRFQYPRHTQRECAAASGRDGGELKCGRLPDRTAAR